MVTQTQKSQVSDLFSRLRRYSRELFALDRRPLLDQTFSFPWSEFSAELKKTFGCEISLTPGPFGWKEKADLFKGIVEPIIPLAIALPGIDGQVILLISRADIERLMIHTLHVDIATLTQQDPSFFDQFSTFFSAELLSCSLAVSSLQSLSPRLTTRQETESAGSLCQDIVIQIQGEQGLARCIIPPVFLEAWRVSRMGPEMKPSPATLADIEIDVSVEAGRTFLNPEEISGLHNGDFLLLDHPFFIPGSTKARVFLTHQGHPLFRAKLEEGNIKILEMPLQHEAFLPLGGRPMSTQGSTPKENPEESDPPISEANPEVEKKPPVTEEPAEKVPENPPKDPPSTPVEENPFEGEEEVEEEKETTPLTEEEVQEVVGIAPTLSKKPIDYTKLPLTVVVELTELSMTIEKLTSLQPGNLLDLDIRPENGVYLVVNGQIFAQGELVLIGDNVGVRIKETAPTQQAT